jgi:hypothetical protein
MFNKTNYTIPKNMLELYLKITDDSTIEQYIGYMSGNVDAADEENGALFKGTSHLNKYLKLFNNFKSEINKIKLNGDNELVECDKYVVMEFIDKDHKQKKFNRIIKYFKHSLLNIKVYEANKKWEDITNEAMGIFSLNYDIIEKKIKKV